MLELGNVFILGDSYSTFKGHIPEGYHPYYSSDSEGGDVDSVEKTWWHQLVSDNNAVLLMNNFDPGIGLGVFVADGTAVVRGTVIHQDDLQIGVGLIDNGVDALAQICFDIIDGNDHTNHRQGVTGVQVHCIVSPC